MGFWNRITHPFHSIEHAVVKGEKGFEKGVKKAVKVVTHHPIESAIIGGSLLLGGAAIVLSGGLATPLVAAEEAAIIGAEGGVIAVEIGAEVGAVEVGAALPELAEPLIPIAEDLPGVVGDIPIGDVPVEIPMEPPAYEPPVLDLPEPIEPIEPFEPVEPIEPIEPIEPVEPVEPMEPLPDAPYQALGDLPSGTFESIKESVMNMARTAQTQFATANEFIEGIENTITGNPIIRGLNAIRQSKVVSTILKMIMALEFIKTTIDILRNKDGKTDEAIDKEDKHTKENQEKINKILDKISQLKDALSKDQSKMTDMQKQMTQQELDNQQKILDQAKQFHQELQAEQLRETHLEQKNTQLQSQLQQDEAKIAQEGQQITQMRNEVEDMKELIGESFLRPLDFSEMMLLMNELESDEIINFLARNRKDYDKLTNKEKKQVIELGKKKMNR